MSFTRVVVLAVLAATVATAVLAETPLPSSEAKRVTNLSCIQKAVEKRENALIDAFGAFTGHGAPKEARNKSNRVKRNAAIRSAWDAFRTARSERRACRVTNSAADTAEETTDAQK